MTEPVCDLDRLDVDRLSIDYVASSFAVAKELSGLHRHARDQSLHAAQSSTSTAMLSTSTRSKAKHNDARPRRCARAGTAQRVRFARQHQLPAA